MRASLKSGDYRRNPKVAGYALIFAPVALICLILASIPANGWGLSANNSGEGAGAGGMVFCLDAVLPHVKRNALEDIAIDQTRP